MSEHTKAKRVQVCVCSVCVVCSECQWWLCMKSAVVAGGFLTSHFSKSTGTANSSAVLCHLQTCWFYWGRGSEHCRCFADELWWLASHMTDCYWWLILWEATDRPSRYPTTIDSGRKARTRTRADTSVTNELMWLERVWRWWERSAACCVLQKDHFSLGRDVSIYVDIRLYTQPGPDVVGCADGLVEARHTDCSEDYQ